MKRIFFKIVFFMSMRLEINFNHQKVFRSIKFMLTITKKSLELISYIGFK